MRLNTSHCVQQRLNGLDFKIVRISDDDDDGDVDGDDDGDDDEDEDDGEDDNDADFLPA